MVDRATLATPVIVEPGMLPGAQFVFDQAPLLIYWEATRACPLACVHCRADAVSQRHPLELKANEVKQLMVQIAAFGGRRLPHLVITGGDPIQRSDLYELIAYGRHLGIAVSVTPAGTSHLTADVVRQLSQAGIASLGLSLDGSDSDRHDAFRGVAGSYDWTLAALRAAVVEGLPVQVNTMVTAQTLADLPAIYELVKELGIARWALFFLIATGRGEVLSEISPAESEKFLNWLWKLTRESPFPIKTTEAHHYRRIAWLKMRRSGLTVEEILRTPTGRGFGIRDGNGIVFISHTGDVYPSGFLPLTGGNVRRQSVVEIYRHSLLFQSLRDSEQLKGKCGRCEFRAICGGSRARAFAVSQDPLESDLLCPYQPRARKN